MATYLELERQKRDLLQEEAELELKEAKEKKMSEEQGFQDGGVLQSKEEIKAEAVAEVVAALALVGKYPELVELLGGRNEDL